MGSETRQPIICFETVSAAYYKNKAQMTLEDCQSAEAWERVKHLPVWPIGYKHRDNAANRGYRRAEKECWIAATKGAGRIELDFIWRLYAQTIHVASIALDRLQMQTQSKKNNYSLELIIHE